MKYKYFYYVILIRQNNKYFAWAEKICQYDNLLYSLKRWEKRGAEIIHQCPSYKYAKELAEAWNNGYKECGNYLDIGDIK